MKFNRQSQTIIIGGALLFGSATWVAIAFWRSNSISPEFRSASRYAFRSIHECDKELAEEGRSFVRCIDNAEKAISELKLSARTHRERVQYALVGSYLRRVRDCRKDWEQSDVSPEAKDRLIGLASSRSDLEQRLGEN